MRLLCDEMLKGVGRWLRAAGYDVATVDDGAHDDDLLARAAAENRLLLTCDRRLAGRAAPDASVIVLRTERFDSAARELRDRAWYRLAVRAVHPLPARQRAIDPSGRGGDFRAASHGARRGWSDHALPGVPSGLLAGQPRAPDVGEAHPCIGRAAAELSFAAAPDLPVSSA
jgi:Mut7-C RNAse domain